MNTITINHKGETIKLATFDQHEQADIAEHFEELAESLNTVAASLVFALNNPYQAEAMIRKALTKAQYAQDMAEGFGAEYRPAA